MNRRTFLLNAFKLGGLAVLYRLGVPLVEAQSIQDMHRAVIARKNSASVGDGLIGSTTSTQSLGLDPSTGRAFLWSRTTTTPGNVRYAHISVNTADGTETVCFSLQQDSDGGTVYLSGSGTAPVSGHFLIDLGSTYEIQASTSYRFVIQNDNTFDVNSSSYGTGFIYQDTSFAYNCGGSVTNDSEYNQRIPAVILDNSTDNPF